MAFCKELFLSNEFISKYDQCLDEISEVIKPQLLSIIYEPKGVDPHDLVRPDTYFDSENSARGYVWSMFLKRAKNITIRKAT